jgi:hypothetical protein
VIKCILRYLSLWEQGVRVSSAKAPPEIVDKVIDPWLDDPFPDYVFYSALDIPTRISHTASHTNTCQLPQF